MHLCLCSSCEQHNFFECKRQELCQSIMRKKFYVLDGVLSPNTTAAAQRGRDKSKGVNDTIGCHINHSFTKPLNTMLPNPNAS